MFYNSIYEMILKEFTTCDHGFVIKLKYMNILDFIISSCNLYIYQNFHNDYFFNWSSCYTFWIYLWEMDFKMNKISLFFVFNIWNDFKGFHHFPTNLHHCFELSSCWFCLLIKNSEHKKISSTSLPSNTILFIHKPQVTRSF